MKLAYTLIVSLFLFFCSRAQQDHQVPEARAKNQILQAITEDGPLHLKHKNALELEKAKKFYEHNISKLNDYYNIKIMMSLLMTLPTLASCVFMLYKYYTHSFRSMSTGIAGGIVLFLIVKQIGSFIELIDNREEINKFRQVLAIVEEEINSRTP